MNLKTRNTIEPAAKKRKAKKKNSSRIDTIAVQNNTIHNVTSSAFGFFHLFLSLCAFFSLRYILLFVGIVISLTFVYLFI